MRRVLLVLCLCAPVTAQAGLGAIAKLAAMAGKTAGKAGTAAKVGSTAGKVGTAAKVGSTAKAVGAVAVAERVFVHVADDGARVAMFVADDGAGALKVVSQSGEAVTHTPGSLGRMVGDLDAMGHAVPGGGVDLYLDAAAVNRLGDLPVGPNTRLWLAKADGVPVRLRPGSSGAPQVAVASHAGRPRLWVEVADMALDAGLRLAQSRPDGDVVVLDRECRVVPPGTRLVRGLADGDGLLVVLTDQALTAAELDRDQVVLRMDDVCGAGGNITEDAAAALQRIQQADTLAEMWAATGVGAPTATLAQRGDGRWTVRGAHVDALHSTGAKNDPVAIGKVLAMVLVPMAALWGLIALVGWRVMRRRA